MVYGKECAAVGFLFCLFWYVYLISRTNQRVAQPFSWQSRKTAPCLHFNFSSDRSSSVNTSRGQAIRKDIALISTRKYEITVCAMLRDTFSYAAEWIVYHAMQGVDQFILYDDFSDDDTSLLGELFNDHFADARVEVLPINFLRKNRQSARGYHDHYANQFSMLSHCHLRYGPQTKWLLFIDSDEYVYSKSYGSLQSFLKSQENHTENGSPSVTSKVTEFFAHAVRFGTAGRLSEIRNGVSLNPFTGVTQLFFTEKNKDHQYPLLLAEGQFRAPHIDLDQDYKRKFQSVCNGTDEFCMHAIGKSIFRAEYCSEPYVHWCKNLTGTSQWASINDLRIDHYAWRSAERVRKFHDGLHGQKIKSFEKFDKVWFSSVFDNAKQNITRHLSENIFSRFRPLFVEFQRN